MRALIARWWRYFWMPLAFAAICVLVLIAFLTGGKRMAKFAWNHLY